MHGKTFDSILQKTKGAEIQCFHCGKDHPANYWECNIAKEMQTLRNKFTNTKKQNSTQQKINQTTNKWS